MGKKQQRTLVWIATIFAAACGVAAFFMIFAKAVSYENFIFGDTFTGLQVALGYTVNDSKIFDASAGILLAFLFPLIGACVAIIGKGNKYVSILASAMLITGGILALCALSLLKSHYPGTPNLEAGPIVSGVLAILGGGVECTSVFVKE